MSDPRLLEGRESLEAIRGARHQAVVDAQQKRRVVV